MPPVPIIRPADCIRALERLGWARSRQSGSHLTMTAGDGRILVVPIHTGTLPRGTLRSIIRMAGVTVELFVERL